MHVQMLSIEAIIPYAQNPRKNEHAVEKVAASLKEFGWQQPIVVDTDSVIIVGHTRFLAAKHLGMLQVPVLVAKNLTPAQAKAYRIADNRLQDEADWDEEKLRLELADLEGLSFDLSLTGFNAEELAGFAAMAESLEAGLTDEDDCPAIAEETVTQLGDVWILGKHRLLCGDSTRLDEVERLMQHERADFVFTDPPYNVDYEGYTDDQLKIAGDHMSDAQFYQFLLDIFASFAAVVKPTVSMYVCHGSIYQREFQNALEANGFVVRNQLVWAKHHFAWGHGRYKFQHEPMFYCYRKGQRDPWYGDKSQTTLWQIDKPTANRLHPTMKPVALIEKALENSSKIGDIALDLFGGSGSTLMACEKHQRPCRLMEIDPHYCDVIVKRWQDFTGKAATLAGKEGKHATFDALAQTRKS